MSKLTRMVKFIDKSVPYILVFFFIGMFPMIGSVMTEKVSMGFIKVLFSIMILGAGFLGTCMAFASVIRKNEPSGLRATFEAVPNDHLTFAVYDKATNKKLDDWTIYLNSKNKSMMGWTTKGSYSGDFWKIFLDLEGKPVTKATIDTQYKKFAQIYHPDKKTGTQQLMVMLNRAKSDALKQL